MADIEIKFCVDERYSELLETLVESVHDIMRHGESKHGKGNFLSPEGSSCSRRRMFDAGGHHAAREFCGIDYDKDSGLPHAAHIAARAAIRLLRLKHGVVHLEDE